MIAVMTDFGEDACLNTNKDLHGLFGGLNCLQGQWHILTIVTITTYTPCLHLELRVKRVNLACGDHQCVQSKACSL